MEEFLRNLQSNDNALRREAEKRFNDALEKDIRSTMNELLQTVLVSNDPGLCQAGAVLFRGQISRKKRGETWWGTLSPGEREDLRKALLQRLSTSPSGHVSRQLGQIIAQVARMSFGGNTFEWPSLLTDLAQMCNHGDPAVAIATIDELIKATPGLIETGSTQMQVLELLVQHMLKEKASNASRIAAVRAIPSLLQLVDEDEAVAYKPAINAMLVVLPLVIGEEEMLLKWFEAMIDCVSMQPRLVEASGQVDKLVVLMAQIAGNECGNKDFSDDARKQALEVCVQLAVEIPRIIKEAETLIRALFKVSIMLMLDSSDDVNDIDEDILEGAASEADLCDAGARAVYFLSECIGEARTLPVLFPMIQELLSVQGDWKKERAGLLALTRAAYSGGKLMYQNLGPILEKMLPYVTNEQSPPKIRLVALDTLSTLFIVFSDVMTLFDDDDIYGDPDAVTHPNIQRMFTEPLLKALTVVLEPPRTNGGPEWMIRSKAAMAVAHFCTGCDDGKGQEVFGHYADDLLEKLLCLIKFSGMIQQQAQNGGLRSSGTQPVDVTDVQASALSAVGAIAKALETGFQKYYATFMPIAKQVYMVQEDVVARGQQQKHASKEKNKWSEKQVRLRGIAMECISYIGIAVGPEIFKQDAGDLMQMVIQYMDNIWPLGDSDRNIQVAQLASNICIAMGDSVDEKILGKLVPPFLAWANKESYYYPSEAELEKLEAESDDEEGDDEMQGRHLIMTDEGIMCLNTFQMKEKEQAVQIIQGLVHELGVSLMPWAGNIAKLMLKELVADMITTPDLQLCAAIATGKLVEAVTKYLTRQTNIRPEQREFAQRLFAESLEACIDALLHGFEEAKQEDMDRLDEMQLGKEIDEDEEQAALVLTTVANQVTLILRAAFESGGRTDSNVDVMCNSEYRAENFPPIFCVPDQDIRGTMDKLVQCMKCSCERPRGHCWWKDAHNHEVMDSISEAVGLLLKTHGAKALVPFDSLVLPLAWNLLDAPITQQKNEGVTAPLKAVGLFFLDDVIEYGGPNARALTPRAVNYMLKYCGAENPVLRQAAAYGLGLCAEHTAEVFNPFAEQVLQGLIKVIESADAKKSGNKSATDNAVSSVLKFILFRNTVSVIPKLLSYLPCSSDALEARTIYYRLMKMVSHNRPPELAQYSTQLRDIFTKAYNDKTGYDKKKGKFDEDYAILSNETRSWIKQEIIMK